MSSRNGRRRSSARPARPRSGTSTDSSVLPASLVGAEVDRAVGDDLVRDLAAAAVERRRLTSRSARRCALIVVELARSRRRRTRCTRRRWRTATGSRASRRRASARLCAACRSARGYCLALRRRSAPAGRGPPAPSRRGSACPTSTLCSSRAVARAGRPASGRELLRARDLGRERGRRVGAAPAFSSRASGRRRPVSEPATANQTVVGLSADSRPA